ncbi:alpha/beta fold hydrolase [Cognatishimia sp.]|uniref:alpha/beta fold hydrolase n=1 Tax=Cognatishimia sp. TaxID=2211648 RepID=UPI003515BBC6
MTSTTLHLSDAQGILSYQDAGAPDSAPGIPLVLLHGVGMQSEAWRPQIDALSKTHRVLALDLPGHGGSSALKPDATLTDYVDWLHAALDALGLAKVNLAGHSMGALISGGFAVLHPDRLARVALLNGVFRRNEDARIAVIERAKLIGSGTFDLETPLNRWFGQTAMDLAARERVSQWLSEVSIAGYATAYAAFAHGDAVFADRFHTIDCPLLALTGDGDLNSNPAMSHAMAAAAPQGRAVIIENHRHMVNLTAPDRVNDALRNWLGTPLHQKDVL